MYNKLEISKDSSYNRLAEKPLIFKEQLKLVENSNNQSCSLQDYKIDYNDYLGSGVFGSVYGIVKRPDNDKNFFSYWFPSTYDYFFRPISVTKQSTQWCVKISNSLVSILYHQISIGNDLFLQPVIASFSEKQNQLSSAPSIFNFGIN